MKRLGKKVQGLWNKIFGKKDTYNPLNPEANSLREGTLYINDEPIGKVQTVSSFTLEERDKALAEIEDIIANTNWNQVAKNLEIEFTTENSIWDKKVLENLANTFYPILPKHYWCKTLILTIAANQPYEYQSMDISQLEEKGIAHFVVGRTIGFQEIIEEYKQEKAELQEEENEDGVEWLREGDDPDLRSTVYGPADLYYYEETGLWDFE